MADTDIDRTLALDRCDFHKILI